MSNLAFASARASARACARARSSELACEASRHASPDTSSCDSRCSERASALDTREWSRRSAESSASSRRRSSSAASAASCHADEASSKALRETVPGAPIAAACRRPLECADETGAAAALLLRRLELRFGELRRRPAAEEYSCAAPAVQDAASSNTSSQCCSVERPGGRPALPVAGGVRAGFRSDIPL